MGQHECRSTRSVAINCVDLMVCVTIVNFVDLDFLLTVGGKICHLHWWRYTGQISFVTHDNSGEPEEIPEMKGETKRAIDGLALVRMQYDNSCFKTDYAKL